MRCVRCNNTVRFRTHPKTDLGSGYWPTALPALRASRQAGPSPEPRATKVVLLGALSEAGNAYMEYFVLALVVLLATITFFNGGFRGTQNNLDDVFNDLARQVAPP